MTYNFFQPQKLIINELEVQNGERNLTEVSLTIGEKKIDPPYSFTIFKPHISEEDYFNLASEDIACELLDGNLIIHSPALLEHEELFRFLFTLLDLFALRTHQGRILGSRFVMQLEPNFITEPDLIFIDKETSNRLKETYLEGSAPFVIEILSPSTRETDLSKKLPRYLSKGVHEVWIVDPENRSITVHCPNMEPTHFQGTDKLECKTLKRLWILPEWLWTRRADYPEDIIDEICIQT